MLGAGPHAEQIARWYDRLEPLAAQTRQQLDGMDPCLVAVQSGCAWLSSSRLALRFLWQEYEIGLPGWTIHGAGERNAPTPFVEAMILTYLVTADGTAPTGRWISYRDLPEGMFYAQAFRGYAEQRLVRELTLPAFTQAAERLGGERLDLGSAGYAWDVLPRVRVAAVYWEGDEELPSQASVLFDEAGVHYMSTDGLAVLGSRLVDRLVRE